LTDEEQCSGSSGSERYQNNEENNEEEQKQAGRDRLERKNRKNNLTRTRSRNPVLFWDLPVSEALLLDEAIAD
jgi:hypothetical protein